MIQTTIYKAWTPYGDTLIVMKLLKNQESKLIIREGNDSQIECSVIKVGTGLRREDGSYRTPDIKENDIILIKAHKFIELEQEEGFGIINISDILATKSGGKTNE